MAQDHLAGQPHPGADGERSAATGRRGPGPREPVIRRGVARSAGTGRRGPGLLTPDTVLRLQRAVGNAAAGAVVVQRATFKIEVQEDGKPGRVVRPVKVPKGGAAPTTGPSAPTVPASPATSKKLDYALPPGRTTVLLREILHDFLGGDPWLNGPFPEVVADQLDKSVKAGSHKIIWNVSDPVSRNRYSASWDFTVTGATATAVPAPEPIPQNNKRKLVLFERLVDVMASIGIDVFLFGGAATNAVFGSPRRLNDLDFRTYDIPDNFNTAEGKKCLDLINGALTGFNVKEPFVQADRDTMAADGVVDDCEVTIRRVDKGMTKYQPSDGAISGEDIIFDKALSFAQRPAEAKQKTDLFDLLWGLKRTGTPVDRFFGELEARRGDQYQAHQNTQKPGSNTTTTTRVPTTSKRLSDQFAVVFAGLLAVFGADQLINHMVADVDAADQKEGKQVRDDLRVQLGQLAAVLGLPLDKGRKGEALKKALGARPVLLVQAGNFTGDMFAVCTALMLNPFAQVLLISDGTARDRSQAIATFYRDSGIEEHRVHVLDSAGVNMGKQHTAFTGGRKGKGVDAKREEIPYEKAEPPVPGFLRGTRFQLPVTEATTQVAAGWRGQETRAGVRAAWGLDGDQRKVEEFVTSRGVPIVQDDYVVLWCRFSGSKGGPHPQHDMGFQAFAQLLGVALGQGGRVIVAGDRPISARARDKWASKIAAAGAHDLREFWLDPGWTDLGLKSRSAQFAVFDLLHTASGRRLKHLGFRSGNLEPYALIGHDVRYIEEKGSAQAGRMDQWKAIGYLPLVVNGRMPTLKGQWVTAKSGAGKEARVPWIKASGGTDQDLKKANVDEILRGADPADLRGFEEDDLKAIREFLKRSTT